MKVWLGSLACVLLLGGVLRGQSDEFGTWTVLFDGKDTKGWVKAKSGQADAPWTVEDGVLTNSKKTGMDLCTEEEFDNYELELEYRVPVDGNSGVYLRGQIEVQVGDISSPGRKVDDAKLVPGHAGGIYGKIAPKCNPQKPPPEWNAFRIRHMGNRITVWHNGALIQDNAYVDGPTGGPMEKSASGPRKGQPLTLARGPIMLQGDHSAVWYRNIRIRKLCSADAGWKPIWNGKDLSEFTCRGPSIPEWWAVQDNAITNVKWDGYLGDGKGGGHDLWTQQEFGNYLLHYEYRTDPGPADGNSGFYLRDQWEIQILKDQQIGDGGKHSDGALYSQHAPKVKARRGPADWNWMDVKLEANKVWVWQNGLLIHDGVTLTKRTDSGEPTPVFSKKAFKLQGDHGRVWFGNLYIKELPPTP